MNDNDNVIETLGKYRLVIRDEQGPDEPDGDGQSPLLRMEAIGHYGEWRATHIRVDGRPTNSDAYIEDAGAKWGGEPDKLEKYLRAYHGAKHFKWYESQDYKYLTYDTSEWREYTGLPEDESEMDPRVVNGGVSMDEYIAWIEGEVYYWAIEYQETWTAETSSDTRQTWETKDSCGGYYGYKWAEERAEEEWQSFLAHLDPRICATCAQDLEKTKDNVREDEWPRFLAMIEPEVLALYGDTPEEQRAGIGELWTHVSDVETDDDHDAIPAGEQESDESKGN